MNNTDIKEIQDLIKSKGLENDLLFRDIMKIDNDKYNREVEYYKARNNKFFKLTCKTSNFGKIEYVRIYDVNELKFGNKHELRVFTDNYSFSYHITPHGHYQYSNGVDLKHWLCTTSVGRFDKYIEISEEQFDNETAMLMNTSKEIAENLNMYIK